jgi:hypothetical protein
MKVVDIQTSFPTHFESRQSELYNSSYDRFTEQLRFSHTGARRKDSGVRR